MDGRRLLLVALVLLNLVLVLRLFFSDQGVFAYLDLRQRYQRLAERIREADARTLELSQDIRSLKSDRQHQEKVIRSRLNFLKENELLYIFPDSREAGAGSASPDEKQQD